MPQKRPAYEQYDIIIDSHAHIFDVPEPSWNYPPFTAEKMIEFMDGPYTVAGETRKVGLALCQPTPGVTILPDWDIPKQHEYVVEAVRKHPDRLVGCMMINPHYGLENAFRELERLVTEEGFRCIKLHPAFHRYWPNKQKDLTYPILEQARRFNIPVLVHTGEPPYSMPSLLGPVAEDFPDVPIMLAHFGIQMIGYSHEAIEVARKHDNVFLGTDWAHLNRLKEGITTLGASKLVFGSDSPYTEIGVGLRTLEVLCWDGPLGVKMSEADREDIFGHNLARLMGLK
ncbi:MAG: amidohydrolase [Chloroflexi bacterium]|nr:amidohydrolase [Chloroflexota bacterium]